MHITDEVKAAFDEVVTDGAGDDTLCIIMTRDYVLYVKPYLDHAVALADIEALHLQHGDVCVCVYNRVQNVGFAKQYPCTQQNIFKIVVSTLALCKVFKHASVRFLFFDGEGELAKHVRIVKDLIDLGDVDYKETVSGDDVH